MQKVGHFLLQINTHSNMLDALNNQGSFRPDTSPLGTTTSIELLLLLRDVTFRVYFVIFGHSKNSILRLNNRVFICLSTKLPS